MADSISHDLPSMARTRAVHPEVPAVRNLRGDVHRHPVDLHPVLPGVPAVRGGLLPQLLCAAR